MGGSGSGGGRRTNHREEETCESLTFITNLSSPNFDVIKGIEVGDELQLSLTSSSTCVAYFQGAVAGFIVHAKLFDLIKCMQLGNDFTGLVRAVSSSRCEVQVVHRMTL